MAVTRTVDTGVMRSTASKIEDLVGQYETQVKKFYSEVEKLRGTTFQGDAASAFKEATDGFNDDFDKMVTRMKAYASYLTQTSKLYDDTDINLKTSANALKR